VLTGVIIFYVIERFWLSEKVEEASPETIHRIEETFHAVEEVAQEKLHGLGERLHLTRINIATIKRSSRKPKRRKRARSDSRSWFAFLITHRRRITRE
jgi:hypothetical protein